MNVLDYIKDFLSRQLWNEATTAPAWRGSRTRLRKLRTPFQGRARRATTPLQMRIEEFSDKDKRDERFHELRAKGTRHVSKFSDVRGGKDLWCVVHP